MIETGKITEASHGNKDVKVGDKTARVMLFKCQRQLVLVVAEKGYVICGYLNMETAEKLGDCAAVVTG